MAPSIKAEGAAPTSRRGRRLMRRLLEEADQEAACVEQVVAAVDGVGALAAGH